MSKTLLFLIVFVFDGSINSMSVNWQGRISLRKVFSEIHNEEPKESLFSERPAFWEKFISSDVTHIDDVQEPIIVAAQV